MNPSQSSLYDSWLELAAQQFLNSTPSSYAKHCLFLVFEGAEGQDNKACTVSWVKVNQYLPDNRYKPEYQSWKMFNNWNYDIITLICILPFVFSSLKYVSDFDLLVFAHWAFISHWALLSCGSLILIYSGAGYTCGTSYSATWQEVNNHYRTVNP